MLATIKEDPRPRSSLAQRLRRSRFVLGWFRQPPGHALHQSLRMMGRRDSHFIIRDPSSFLSLSEYFFEKTAALLSESVFELLAMFPAVSILLVRRQLRLTLSGLDSLIRASKRFITYLQSKGGKSMPIRWASSFMTLISAWSESSDSGSTVWELMTLSTSMHARSQALFFP